MRFEIKNDNSENKESWYKWFAWHPVRVQNTIIWFEYVWRHDIWREWYGACGTESFFRKMEDEHV